MASIAITLQKILKKQLSKVLVIIKNILFSFVDIRYLREIPSDSITHNNISPT